MKQKGHLAPENGYEQKIDIGDEKVEPIYENDNNVEDDQEAVAEEGEEASDAYKISDVDEGLRKDKKIRIRGKLVFDLVNASALGK